MEFKAEIKKTFTGPDKLRAVCSVVLDDCFLVKNVRVVEGEKGLFVSLPSRRNVKGEWVEHCFPMTKELRAKLSAAVLEAYEAAVQAHENGFHGAELPGCIGRAVLFQSLSGAAKRRPQKGGGC